NGKSTFTVVVPAQAPDSVKNAARELQRDIKESTGATLPFQKETDPVSGNIISLGSTQQAAAAHVTTEGIADEGFRIITRGENIFILGPDTVAKIGSSSVETSWRSDNMEYQLQPDVPGNQLTQNGGFSNGTANGVYTFLEDYLGVRWLFPGDLGRDVPAHSTLIIPDIDRTDAPGFIWRDFPHLQNTRAVAQWRDQQKLGFSFRLNFNHNWVETVRPAMYKEHPEWFAMINGKRPEPPTSGPKRNHYKLETTNPELVEYFAEQ